MKKILNDIFNNKVLITFCCLVTIFSLIFSLSYAIKPEQSSSGIKGNIVRVDEEAYNKVTFDSNNFELKPILDNTVDANNPNIIKLNFLVGGSKDNNIDDIIYDVSLTSLELDCELLSPYMKWRLVKNGEIISEGSLDYQFDTIKNGRLVLTTIQQDLKDYSEDKSTYDQYDFYMWLSDSCQDEDLNNCIISDDQESLLNKTIKGQISVELNVKTKKELVRKPSETLDTTVCINRMEGE